MSCSSVTKFVITKGFRNEFVFTIKEDGSTLPIAIKPTDTFTAVIKLLSTGAVAASIPLTVVSAPIGKVKLVISPAIADSLISSKGAEEDRYYTRPTYSLVLDCKTAANGPFLAKVPYVYVE